MAENGDITLYKTGESEVLLSSYGRRVKKSWEEGGRSDRTFSGPLKTDITWRRYRFEIPYSLITPAAYTALFALYNLDCDLNLKLYTSPTTWFLNFDGNIPVVKMEPFGDERFVQSYSKNVNLVLIEI